MKETSSLPNQSFTVDTSRARNHRSTTTTETKSAVTKAVVPLRRLNKNPDDNMSFRVKWKV